MTTYAEDAWTQVIRTIHRYGMYRASEGMAALESTAARIVRDMGGFYALCISTHGDRDRDEFLRRYNNLQLNNGGKHMKITVEFDSTQEMRDFCQQFGGAAPIRIELGDTPAPEPEKKKTKKEAALPVQPAAAPATPAQAATAALTAAPAIPTPAPAAAPAALTHDTVARAAAKLIRANPATKDPIKAVLTRYKVDMIPNLPAEALPAFAQELRILGGEL